MTAVEESPIAAYPDGHDGPLTIEADEYVSTLINLMRKDGVTFQGGKKLALPALRKAERAGFIHAEAEAEIDGREQRIAISFGPQYGAVPIQQVEQAARGKSASSTRSRSRASKATCSM